MPVKIVRWDQWLADPRLPAVQSDIENIVSRNQPFKSAMLLDISNFYARKGYDLNPGNAKISCRYYVEELAAHTLLHRDHNVATIYPGKQLETYRMIRSRAVREFPAGIENSPYIRLIPHEVPASPALSAETGNRIAFR